MLLVVLLIFRLLILGCHVTYKMRIAIYLMEERFQSSGHHPKPFVLTNILLLVMFGVMGVCFMSSGVLEIFHSLVLKIVKYVLHHSIYYI